ncbi:MAG: hypothetical protein Q4D13_02665 [Erysipelotrichaceae bacterium]|nr:hypothetical protein [Erysipelotrichaceae bacterium]
MNNMKIGIWYLESTNAQGESINRENYQLIEKLADLSGAKLEIVEVDKLHEYDLTMIFVGGGGVEGRFLKIADKLPQPVFLLTSGANNSLAASMEILSYMRQNDIPGEIIHGSETYMAERIKSLYKVFKAKKRLNSFRLGRVGVPSDWLISSDVDADLSKEINGIEIIDIKMEEFFNEIKRKEYEDNSFTLEFKKNPFDEKEKELALEIYGALKRIVDKYQLDGVTVRCFDLLKPVKSTGCVALAILNAEGIYAACEGDVPALISMAVLGELTGEPCFQANPSKILTDTNEIIFAHCTLPVNMYDSVELMTHYESGLGVSFRGHIREGEVTVFKTDGLAQRDFVSGGILEENLNQYNLCRTQIKLKMEESVEYFLKESIGNHHIIIKGDYVDLINEFYRWF